VLSVISFFLFFFVCESNISGNRCTDLRQIHREDVFHPSLGRIWMWRSKVKVTRDKNALHCALPSPLSHDGMERARYKCHAPADDTIPSLSGMISAACVWSIFGKTFLAAVWDFFFQKYFVNDFLSELKQFPIVLVENRFLLPGHMLLTSIYL